MTLKLTGTDEIAVESIMKTHGREISPLPAGKPILFTGTVARPDNGSLSKREKFLPSDSHHPHDLYDPSV